MRAPVARATTVTMRHLSSEQLTTLRDQLEREREAIVAACVREVMRRLERKRER